MRVIVAHTNDIHPLAAEALSAFAPQAEYVENIGLDGYDETIVSRWDGSDDLVVIEQDKEITADVIPAFERCNQDWCCFAYYNFPDPYRKRIYTGLGCTRYSAEVQRLVPSSEFSGPDPGWYPGCKLCDGKGCWRNLDARIASALIRAGVVTHIHGDITHHHSYRDPVTWVTELANTFEPDERLLMVAPTCPVCNANMMYCNRLECSKCDFKVL